MDNRKEIRLTIDLETYRKFLMKCFGEDTKPTKKIRLWIQKFLMGEIT